MGSVSCQIHPSASVMFSTWQRLPIDSLALSPQYTFSVALPLWYHVRALIPCYFSFPHERVTEPRFEFYVPIFEELVSRTPLNEFLEYFSLPSGGGCKAAWFLWTIIMHDFTLQSSTMCPRSGTSRTNKWMICYQIISRTFFYALWSHASLGFGGHLPHSGLTEKCYRYIRRLPAMFGTQITRPVRTVKGL